jgi:uncharacterized protein (DUF1778 family)
MGQPKKPDDQKRDRHMSLRFKPDEYAAICAAAEAMTLEPPAYVRWAAFAQAKTVKK